MLLLLSCLDTVVAQVVAICIHECILQNHFNCPWWPGDVRSHFEAWFSKIRLIGFGNINLLFGVKPMPAPMMTYCQWTLNNRLQRNWIKKSTIPYKTISLKMLSRQCVHIYHFNSYSAHFLTEMRQYTWLDRFHAPCTPRPQANSWLVIWRSTCLQRQVWASET